ncbi:hypothetical protein B2I21_28095 [Chryseobacterium mucoviscidosis]|nr:hypothetical protein B2I21_28095 [Chryseobacterium mucoviscidosis]
MVFLFLLQLLIVNDVAFFIFTKTRQTSIHILLAETLVFISLTMMRKLPFGSFFVICRIFKILRSIKDTLIQALLKNLVKIFRFSELNKTK